MTAPAEEPVAARDSAAPPPMGPATEINRPEIRAQFRSDQPTDDLGRTLLQTTITTLGENTATTPVEYQRRRSGRRGRQSQTRIRMVACSRFVAAHVSLDAPPQREDALVGEVSSPGFS